jgi:hypothetical protein
MTSYPLGEYNYYRNMCKFNLSTQLIIPIILSMTYMGIILPILLNRLAI